MKDRIGDLADGDLAALRYVTGEMAPDEVLAFEAQLAEDQTARDSVGRLVLIGAAVVREAAPTPVPVPSPSHVPVPAPRLGTAWWWAAAAVLAATGLLFFLGRSKAETPREPGVPATVAQEESADGAAPHLLASWVDLQDLYDTDDPLEFADEPEGDDAAALAAPSWMVEALAR